MLAEAAAAAAAAAPGAYELAPSQLAERAPLPLPLELCLLWLGCPGACSAAAISPAATCLMWSLPQHGSCCPQQRRCDVCGFSVKPGRMKRHRAACGHWSVDGLLLRHYVVGVPQVKACQHAALISATVQAFDAADFVGVCRKDSTGDWSVDGLLLRHYVVGIPEVKASGYSALISAAVQAFDAADF